MNRKNEFEAMIGELNRCAPGLETTLDRAYRKKRKRTMKMIVRPVAGLAACFLIFVFLVNFSAPVAYACSKIPILRELAAAVTFSQSLTDAVENEYVQTIDLTQTENDITAEIAYLIVDQKQVNIFYRLDSDVYTDLEIVPGILNSDGTHFESYSCANNSFDVENGELRSITIDFVDGNVPGALRLHLDVYSTAMDFIEVTDENVDDFMYPGAVYTEPDYIAKFDFLLEFDPNFTASGKVIPVDQTVILEGQSITITDIDVYPTHMRVDIEESAENTAWIMDLDFYIETDQGMKFDPVSNGITATGSADSLSMVSYRADSTYFYEAEQLKLVITGAQWLRKDMDTTYVNLVTGETGELPEGAAFESAERRGSGWIVTFRMDWDEDEPMYQPFGYEFYDADGNAYGFNEWSDMPGDEFFYTEFPLKNFPYDEVWLCPQYSHNWVAEDPTVITVNCESADTEVIQ